MRPILIVFTLTNDVTDEVFVGTTKDSVEERWKQYQDAAKLDHTAARLFKDIRDFGADKFTISEYAAAYDREDLKDMFEEAMDEFNGISLVGVKTTKPKPVKAVAKKIAAKKSTTTRTTSAKATTSNAHIATKLVKEKVSTGRTNSAAKERAIKEAIAEEKAERESQKLAKAAAEAQEMRDIMARLDNRGSTLKKR